MDKLCRKCKSYLRHDEYFGYCIKYNCQAKHDDNCKNILMVVADE